MREPIPIASLIISVPLKAVWLLEYCASAAVKQVMLLGDSHLEPTSNSLSIETPQLPNIQLSKKYTEGKFLICHGE